MLLGLLDYVSFGATGSMFHTQRNWMLQSRLHNDLWINAEGMEICELNTGEKNQAGFAILFLFDLGQVTEISLYFSFLQLFNWSECL